jgi:hypothetical protein
LTHNLCGAMRRARCTADTLRAGQRAYRDGIDPFKRKAT